MRVRWVLTNFGFHLHAYIQPGTMPLAVLRRGKGWPGLRERIAIKRQLHVLANRRLQPTGRRRP